MWLLQTMLLPLIIIPTVIAAEGRVAISPSNLYAGEAVIIRFPANTPEPITKTFSGGKILDGKISFFPYRGEYRALAALPVTAPPGNYELFFRFRDGSAYKHLLTVSRRPVKHIELEVPPQLHTTPKKLVKSVMTAKANVEGIFAAQTDKLYFTRPFGLPLADNHRILSQHGELRRSGSEIIRHLGVDLGAPLGTPVYAVNDGMVMQSGDDTIYGKNIIIDHGFGIYSFYLHLNRAYPQRGALVKKGRRIGTVGETGYATGSHLHLTIKINSVSVDPLSFIANFR